MKSEKEIRKNITKIISDVTMISKDKITEHISLKNDLWIDSMQAVQIIALLEEEYKLDISNIEIYNVDTVSEIVNLIKEYINEKKRLNTAPNN